MADKQDKDAQTPAEYVPPSFKGLGLGSKSVSALEAMAYKGVPLPNAARDAGIRPDNLNRTFAKPKVRAIYNQILMDIRQNAGMQAYVRNVDLSATASSEHVRLEANKWVAGVDGIAALKRVEGNMHHTHQFKGFAFGEFGETIEAQAEEASVDDDD